MGTGQYSASFVERHLRKGSKLQNMLLHCIVQEDVLQKITLRAEHFFYVHKCKHIILFLIFEDD